VTWGPTRGLTWDISVRHVRKSLQNAVERRIRDGRYYVAFAVRGAKASLIGLRFDRARAAGPEVLGCIAADEALWRARHGNLHLVGDLVTRQERRLSAGA